MAERRLVLEKADLLSDEAAWEQIFARHQIDYVLQTASQFLNSEPKNPDDLLIPAIRGTTSVLKAARKYNVKRVVLTSSISAIIEPMESKTYTPEDWSNPAMQTSTYGKSKTLAEKAAWDILKDSTTELTVMNPGFLLGPTLYSDGSLLTGFESGDMIAKIITGNMGAVPEIQLAPVDVRDVAEAHVRALWTPAAAGKRLICASKGVWFKDLHAAFAMLAGVKPAKNIPHPIFVCIGCFSPEAKAVRPWLRKEFACDDSRTKEILDMSFTPLEVYAQDMVKDLNALGATAPPTVSGQ
jgi:dihydroflavonol-4-reductase